MKIRLARATGHAQWLPLWQAYQAFDKVDIKQRASDAAVRPHCRQDGLHPIPQSHLKPRLIAHAS